MGTIFTPLWQLKYYIPLLVLATCDCQASPSKSDLIKATLSSGAGSEDGVQASVSITLSSHNTTSKPATFQLKTLGGSAIEDVDFAGVSGITVSIPTGSTTITLSIPVIDDALNEGRERVAIQVTSLNEGITSDSDSLEISLFDNDEKLTPVTEIVPILQSELLLRSEFANDSLDTPSITSATRSTAATTAPRRIPPRSSLLGDTTLSNYSIVDSLVEGGLPASLEGCNVTSLAPAQLAVDGAALSLLHLTGRSYRVRRRISSDIRKCKRLSFKTFQAIKERSRISYINLWRSTWGKIPGAHFSCDSLRAGCQENLLGVITTSIDEDVAVIQSGLEDLLPPECTDSRKGALRLLRAGRLRRASVRRGLRQIPDPIVSCAQ